MRYAAQFATIGHLTVGPTTNICGRVDVGVERESALQADKLVLAFSVPFGDMPARRALPARIARIDRDQENTSKHSLVGQEGAKLVERPTTQSCTLLSPNRYSVVDPFEFLNGNSTLSAFGFGNDLLRDAMVHVSSKACFLTAQAFEFTLRTSRTSALQFGTQVTATVAHVIDLATRHLRSVRGSGDGFDTEVHAKKVVNVLSIRVRNVARRGEIELAAMVNQVGLALLRLQKFFLSLSSGVSNLESFGSCPDTHHIRLERQDAGVVTDGTMLGKLAAGFLVQFVCIGNLGKDVYNHLSAQREPFFSFVVKQFMQRELPEHLMAPSVFANPITAGIGLLNCVEQSPALVGICIQPEFSCEFQRLKNNRETNPNQWLSADAESLFLPDLKDGVSEA